MLFHHFLNLINQYLPGFIFENTKLNFGKKLMIDDPAVLRFRDNYWQTVFSENFLVKGSIHGESCTQQSRLFKSPLSRFFTGCLNNADKRQRRSLINSIKEHVRSIGSNCTEI